LTKVARPTIDAPFARLLNSDVGVTCVTLGVTFCESIDMIVATNFSPSLKFYGTLETITLVVYFETVI